MSTPPARTPRLAPEARRKELLDAALDVMATEGFEGVTVQAVADRAGITRPVVYDLFGDLDGLLVALVEREEQVALGPLMQLVGHEPGDVDPDRFLVDGVRAFLDAVHAAPRTWRMVLMPPNASSPDMRASVERSRDEITERTSALLDWGFARRGGPTGLDTVLLGRLVVALGEDAARLSLAHPRRYSPEVLADAAERLVRLLPRGGAATAPASVAFPPDPVPAPLPPVTEPVSRRVPRAERREQLLDHTLVLLADGGFDGLTVEAIARRAGVSRVIVYRTFGNLQVLLLALLQRENARIQRQLETLVPRDAGGRSPGELIVDVLQSFLRIVTADALTWRVALQRPESAPLPLQKLANLRRTALAKRLRPLVGWGLESLELDAEGLDPDLLSRLLLTVGEEQGRIALGDPAFPVARLVDSTRRFVALLPFAPR